MLVSTVSNTLHPYFHPLTRRMRRAQASGHFVKDFSFAFGVLNTCHPISISKTLAFYSTKSNKTPSFCLVPACSSFFSCGKWPLWIGAIEQHCTLMAAAFSTSSRIMDLATFTVPWAHRKLGNSSAFLTTPNRIRNAHLRSLFGLQLLSFCLDLEANYTSHFC